MERTKAMYYKPSTESKELTLCSVNMIEVWPRMEAVIKMLSMKARKGIYNADKAIEAFYPIMTEAAKIYCREYGNKLESFSRIFSVTDRFTAAIEIEKYFRDDIIRGEYNDN